MSPKKLKLRSDALYKLCKKFGAQALEIVGAGNGADKDHSLKARLIAYYMNWEGEWSRAKELKDWKGHNISALKYKTYKAIAGMLTEYGDWPSKQLHQMLGYISWAVANGAYEFALDLCEVAIPLAKEKERFGELAALLRLEREAIDRVANESGFVAGLVMNNRHNMAECVAHSVEVHRMEEFRAEYFEPIKRKSALEGGIDSLDWRGLAEEIAKLDESSLKTVRGKAIFLSVKSPCLAVFGQMDSAFESGIKLVNLYKANSWLAEEKRSEFIQVQGSVAMIAASRNDGETSRQIITELGGMLQGDAGSDAVLVETLTQANLLVGYILKDSSFVLTGLELLSEHERAIAKTDGPKRLAFILFYAALGCIQTERWSLASRYLNTLMGMKTNIVRKFFVHVRVLWLLCQLHLPNGAELILSSVDATCKFLRRQEGGPFLLRVTQVTGRIASIPESDHPNLREVIKWAIQEITHLIDSPYGQAAMTVYDYLSFLQNYLNSKSKSHRQ